MVFGFRWREISPVVRLSPGTPLVPSGLQILDFDSMSPGFSICSPSGSLLTCLGPRSPKLLPNALARICSYRLLVQ